MKKISYSLSHEIQNLLSSHAFASAKEKYPRFFIPKHGTIESLEQRYIKHCLMTDLSDIYKETIGIALACKVERKNEDLIQEIEYSLESILGPGEVYYEKARLTPFCNDKSYEFVMNSTLKEKLKKRSEESNNYINMYRKFCMNPSVIVSSLHDRFESISFKSWQICWAHQHHYMEENIVRDIFYV